MNESEILKAAQEIISAAERVQLLDLMCGSDSESRSRIESRLQATALRESDSSEIELTQGISGEAVEQPADFGGETARTQIGAYRLLQRQSHRLWTCQGDRCQADSKDTVHGVGTNGRHACVHEP